MNSIKVITLPWPDKDIRSNSRAHKIKSARKLAWAVAMEAPRITHSTSTELFIEYYPAAYREDIHNVPTGLKAYIDGIADAMGCSDKAFKVHYPDVWAGKSQPGKVVFRIVPAIVKIPLVGVIS